MTIRPATVHFRLYQGATFSELQVLKDSDGNLVDLTGYTAHLQSRRDIADTSPTLDLTTENGGIALGGATGQIQLTVSASDTADFTVDLDGEAWVHELQLIIGSVVQRTYQGYIYVYPAVVRV